MTGQPTAPHDAPRAHEVVVHLIGGWTLRSGVYDPAAPGTRTCGEYVRLVAADGTEQRYWDSDEWDAEPVTVMGAIFTSTALAQLHARRAAGPGADADLDALIDAGLLDPPAAAPEITR